MRLFAAVPRARNQSSLSHARAVPKLYYQNMHPTQSRTYALTIRAVFFRFQQAASLEKVLKEQQQQQLDLERTWEQDRDANKGNGNTSPASDQRLQEHSPPPPSDISQKSISSTTVSQAQVTGPQLMSSPVPGLHHMQQLLQQHVLSPTQLQSLMKQHSLLQQQQQQQVWNIYIWK